MAQLNQDFDEFEKRDTIVVAVGPEDKSKFKKYWEENDLVFIGLPDENHHVLELYGQKIKVLKLGRMPGQMIIDKKGILRYVHYGNSMKDIPENEEVFELLDELL
jgi:peroxiredoxin Q/BCP